MQFAGEIGSETVEREERWIGDESAETRLTRTIDGRSVALTYLQRNVVNDTEGGLCTPRHRPSRHHSDCDENETNIHWQVSEHDCASENSSIHCPLLSSKCNVQT